MSGTNTSITTEYRDGILIPVSLAAAAVVLMGTFAVVGADGYAVASANVGAADQTCIGLWESDAENLGAAGAVHRRSGRADGRRRLGPEGLSLDAGAP